MNISELKKKSLDLVGMSNMKELFALLEPALASTILHNDLLLLKNRFYSLAQRDNKGTIPKSDLESKYTNITVALIDFVHGINPLNATKVIGKQQEEYLYDIGLDEVASSYQSKLKVIIDGEKINLVGKQNALNSYVNSIKRTNWRFLTTSFLDSEFWYQPGDSFNVIHENREMYDRILKNSNLPESSLKRLFIIPDYFDSYIYNQVDFAISQEKLYGNSKFLDRIIEINFNLLELSSKIEMKIIEKQKLPKIYDKDFDPKNNKELALYDDFRIDTFTVDGNNSISSVEVYTKKFNAYSTIEKAYVRYFDLAWDNDSTRDIKQYIESITEEIDFQKENKIDYETNWLLRYDYYVLSNNFVLSSEKSRVIDFLKNHVANEDKTIENYLDIGVCTARYPLALLEENLVKNIDTIDSDYDVELFMKYYRPNINFLRVDIRSSGVVNKLSSKYDLITCMLGTICHFGIKSKLRKYKNKSGLIRALENILALLNSGGIFIISTWKKWNVLKEDLKLYNTKDIKILKANTPSKDLLSQVIVEINKDVSLVETLGDEFFNIYVFRKK